MNSNVKPFIIGIIIAIIIFAIGYSIYFLVYGEPPKAIQSIQNSTSTDLSDEPIEEDTVNLNQDLNDSLMQGLEPTLNQLDDIMQNIEGNDTLDALLSLGESTEQPAVEITTTSEFVKEVYGLTEPLNIKYYELKNEVDALRSQNLLSQLKAFGPIKEKVNDHLALEKDLLKKLGAYKVRSDISAQDAQYISLVGKVNNLHIQILETSLARLENMDNKFDDLEQWDLEADEYYKQSKSFIK